MDLCGLPEWISTILCGLLVWIVQPFRGSSSQSTAELDENKELDRILSKFYVLQRRIQDSVGSSSRSTPEDVSLPTITKINDYVHEVSISSDGHKVSISTATPSVEIVFFHGLQLNGSTYLHITTWLSRDKSKLWLVWLLEEIPDARILVVSYDACAKQTGDHGTLDLYLTQENMLHSFTSRRANIGQSGCPVVLVGHCLGGLVMKELCVQANSILSKRQHERVENLLQHVKGLFFYASPHHGSRLADSNKTSPKGALFENFNTHSKHTARRNEAFRQVREKYKWKTFGVGEGSETTLGNYFKGIVVPEASARSDVDGFYTIADADHFTVCQPDCKQMSSFHLLSDFVADVLKQDQNQLSTKMSLSAEGVGLEARVEEISKTLQDVQRLGVVGIGGIGKTTLVKAVFDTILGRFDYTCFLGEMKKSMGAGEDSKNLQTLILSKLHHNGRQVNKENFFWSTLKGKKVLIVLDDADNESQVMVMTESDGFSKDSRVIVTARDTRFLIAQDFSILRVKQLSLDDSIRLFCLHAFKRPVAPKAYEKQVTRFAEKSGGLPLALKITGKYLYSQSAEAWNGAFDKLRQAKPVSGSKEDGLWSILRVSYNDLADDEQEMFLDVATCFHGENLKEVQKAWRVCSWGSPVTGWQNLVDRGMVGEAEGKIWMHEVLRDLGRSIACPNPRNVAAHTRVFDVRVTRQLLNEGKARVLRITQNDRGSYFHELFKMHFLGGLKELQILWLDGYSLDWPESMGDVFLPQLVFLKMECFPRDIVALQQLGGLQSCLSIHLSFPWILSGPHALKHSLNSSYLLEHFLSSMDKGYQLEHLELQNCRWLETIPKEFGNLSALQHLELMGCHNLTTLPAEFGNLYELQHFELTDCNCLTTLPPEFGNLSKLQHLKLTGCYNLRTLPGEFGNLSELQHLELTGCYSLLTLPTEFGNLSELQHLELEVHHLELTGCHNLTTLCRLQHLEVTDCHNLTTLPAEFANLSQLQHLKLTGCERLTTVPAEFGNLSHLQHLELSGSQNLTTLPAEFGKLSSLQHSELSDCENLMTLPAEFGNLSSLQHLQLSSCENLRRLPAEFGNLSHLRYLELDRCQNLTRLPAEFGKLSQLQHLQLRGCNNLTTLPAEFGELSHLQHLQIWICNNLTTLPAEFGKLSQLQHLKLLRCRNLTTLPAKFGNLPQLEHLELLDCENLKTLPAEFGKLQRLRRLIIRNDIKTGALQELPDSFVQLESLEVLEIVLCSHLAIRLSCLRHLRHLKRLQIESCEKIFELDGWIGLRVYSSSSWTIMTHLGDLTMEELRLTRTVNCKEGGVIVRTSSTTFEDIQPDGYSGSYINFHSHLSEGDAWAQSKALRRLRIQNGGLPDWVWQLGALEYLRLDMCRTLRALPAELGQLRSLKELIIEDCHSLTELPQALGQLGALEELRIRRCHGLKALPDTLGQLGALQDLSIRKCGLEALPVTLGNLEALKRLTVSECNSLSHFPESVGQLRALSYFEICSCECLRALPDTRDDMPALMDMIIKDCPSLTYLPDSIWNLPENVLFIYDCPHLFDE